MHKVCFEKLESNTQYFVELVNLVSFLLRVVKWM
jgi:hypothetical protein